MAFKLNLGALGVDLVLDSGSFKKEIGAAAKSVDSGFGKIRKFAKKIGPAVMAGLAVAGTAIAGVAAGIVSLVQSFASAADDIAKASKRVGMTTSEFQELTYAAGLSGAEMGDVETAMRRLAKNANDTSNGVGIAKDAFKELGIEVTDTKGRLKGQMDLFTETADALSKTENATKRMALANDIFGRGGAKLLPLLNEGAEGIEKMRKEAQELGIVIGGEAAAQAERYNDAMSKMTQAGTGLKNLLGSALIPIFTAAAEIVVELTKEVLKSGQVQTFLKDAVTTVVRGIQGLVRSIINLAKPLSAMISGVQVAVNVWRVFFNVGTIVRKGIATIALTIAQFVTGSMSGFIDAAAEAADFFGMSGLGGSLDKFGSIVGGVADGMGDMRDELVDSIDGDIDDIADSIGGVVDGLGDMADSAHADTIVAAGEKIIDVLDNVGTATVNATEEMDNLGDAATDVKQAVEEIDIAGIVADAANAAGKEIVAAREADAMAVTQAYKEAIKEIDAINVRKMEEARAAYLAAQPSAAGKAGSEAAGSLLGPVGEAAAGMANAATSAGALASAAGGLVTIFAKLWADSEAFQRVMSKISELFSEVFGPVIETAMSAFEDVLDPIIDLFKALKPVIQAFLFILSPWILALKLVAKLFKALAKPIKSLIEGVRRAVNGIRVAIANIGRKKKNKAYLDDEGRIVDPKGKIGRTQENPIIIIFDEVEESAKSVAAANEEQAEATHEHNTSLMASIDTMSNWTGAADRLRYEIRMEEIERRKGIAAMIEFADKMNVSAAAMVGFDDYIDHLIDRENAANNPMEFVFENGQIKRRGSANAADVLGLDSDSIRDSIRGMRDSFGSAAEAASDLASSLLNAPEVFDAALARYQAASGGSLAGVPGGSFTPVGGGGGGISIGTLTVTANNPQQLEDSLQRLARMRNGTPLFMQGTQVGISDFRRI